MKRMSPSKIDWPGLTHTWNPIVGCKHGCNYCIAEIWNKRYNWIPKWNKPEIFENRMDWPYNHNKPCSVFVVFLGDLFGNWVEGDFIRRVLKVCANNPQHKFWFLTKNPRRYQYFEFSRNCRIGVTITGKEDHWTQQQKYDYLLEGSLNSGVLDNFISVEPLQGEISIDFTDRSVDLMIVGAQTNPNVKPEKSWIESCKAKEIHWKNNIRKYL